MPNLLYLENTIGDVALIRILGNCSNEWVNEVQIDFFTILSQTRDGILSLHAWYNYKTLNFEQSKWQIDYHNAWG